MAARWSAPRTRREGKRRGEARGRRGRAAGAAMVGGAAGGGLKMALTGGPTCQRRVGGEREMVGWRDKMGRLVFGPRGLSGGLGC
jgi:hypothetical protein